MDLYLSITNGIVSSKIYDKGDDYNFEIVNFPVLDGDVPRCPSYGIYIFLSVFVLQECVLMLMKSTTETYFSNAKIIKQGFRYHKNSKSIF